VSGWLSTAISDEMMLFTSSPLPMPAELIDPVALVDPEVMEDVVMGVRAFLGGS